MSRKLQNHKDRIVEPLNRFGLTVVAERLIVRLKEADLDAAVEIIADAAIGRRNFLFTGSKDAAERLAAGDAMVQSCRNLGSCVREYLVTVMIRREAGWPARRLTELLPHSWLELRVSEPATAQPGAG